MIIKHKKQKLINQILKTKISNV